MKNGKRDYKREYDKYHSREEQKTNRAQRNAGRSEMEKAGKVRKGDGKDVDHTRPLSRGGSTGRSNLRVVPEGKNRSFSRNKDGSLKNQKSKRER